eukprot:g9700.t1
MQRTYSRSRGTRASLARADADTIDPDDLDPNDPNVHTYITEHNTTHRVVVRSAFSKFIHNHLRCANKIKNPLSWRSEMSSPVMMMPQMGGIPEHYKTENMQGFQYQNEELNTGGT